MGLLIDGQWHDRWYDTKKSGGHFKRKATSFHDWVGQHPEHPAEAGRYHLYVAWACPWAHRTLIFRALKGLESAISVSVVDPLMLDKGWSFSADKPDHIGGVDFLHQVYTAARPNYTGRVTVPILWDKRAGTIVNNESSEIIRMLNSEFDAFATRQQADLWPEALREEIEAVNERVYHTVNNGVYMAGFATTQAAYDQAVTALFESLDWLEQRLSTQRYLVGGQITEADWRLFTTLARFDLVYHGHFKCNRRRLVDYPNLWAYTRELYQVPGVAETTNFAEITLHYHGSHETVNPHRIVPIGPDIDWLEAPGRG